MLWLVLLPTEFGNSLSISVLWLILTVGGWMSLAVEIFVITPLLIAHQRYRWGWLNGWTGTALGFFLGAAPWPLMLLAFSDLDVLTVVAALDMAWKTGLVGATAAVVFRLLAVAPVE
ncbi:hypothetical protein JIP62_00530 [Brevundimonas vitis]|uniref:Uncharacterized protein n=1 Tax=Brevundimonas vitisensis TaxID=2800818 RepID=A0ABX7BN60_9CAUL|nr:hypothetical protein [Brevundimonas vitisensis]QQQ18677.1 hypothetical protein JIP62_00530 [Brevundimonas vitisensis]